MFNFNRSIFLLCLFFVYATANETNLNKDLDEINTTKRRSKLAACMSIIRNSLASGNVEIKSALSKISEDKSKAFDRIVLSITKNCVNSIKQQEIDKVLNPDNILTPSDEMKHLLKFDPKLIEGNVEPDAMEIELTKDINEALVSFDSDVASQDEEVGFAGVKLSQLGYWNYLFVVLAFLIFFIVVLGGLYSLMRKEKKNAKKANKKYK